MPLPLIFHNGKQNSKLSEIQYEVSYFDKLSLYKYSGFTIFNWPNIKLRGGNILRCDLGTNFIKIVSMS